ncbi:hypothetical protein BTR19_19670 [Pseudomonas fluorescens]|nr:hypothetical protein BTR19_19670 [Pseudomonas fluorescens]
MLDNLISKISFKFKSNNSQKVDTVEAAKTKDKIKQEEIDLENEENMTFLKKKALRQLVKTSMPQTFQILADTAEDRKNLNYDFRTGILEMEQIGQYLDDDLFTDIKIEKNVRFHHKLYTDNLGELRTQYVANHTRELLAYSYLKNFTDKIYEHLEDQLIYNFDKKNYFTHLSSLAKYIPAIKPNNGNLFKKIYTEHKKAGQKLTEKEIRTVIEEDIKSFERSLVKYIDSAIKKSPMLRTIYNENLKTDEVLKELYVNDMRDISDEIILHELYKYHKYIISGKDNNPLPLALLFTSPLSEFKIEERRLEIIQDMKNKELQEEEERERDRDRH